MQSNRLIKVMEKEIELIRMSSTEIMEKVAAYKDEQIIILNQVNKVNETEQYSSIRADFFLAILCLRGKASLSLNNNSYEIGRNDLMICHPQTLLKHGMIGDDFECCGFCLSPEYAKRIFVMSTSANNWYSRLYLEQHPIISLNDEESQLFCQYYNLLNSKLTGTPPPPEGADQCPPASLHLRVSGCHGKIHPAEAHCIQFIQQSVQCLHGAADIFLPQGTVGKLLCQPVVCHFQIPVGCM